MMLELIFTQIVARATHVQREREREKERKRDRGRVSVRECS